MFQRDYYSTNFVTSLRAIAIILVFFIHAGGCGLRDFGRMGNFIVDAGKYGVQIFFVLSGFTIFNQLFNEKYSLKNFLTIRFLRISIPYYPILLALFVYNMLGGFQFNGWTIMYNNGAVSIPNLIAHFIYLSPYNLKWQNTIIGIEWTLGIEIFFYAFFALMVKLNLIKNEIRYHTVFISFFFISYFFFPLLEKAFNIDSLFFHWMPFRYGFIFYIGGLSYYFRSILNSKTNDNSGFASDVMLITLALSSILLVLNSRISNKIDMELWFVFITFMVITFFDNKCKLSFLLNNKALIFLGSISYSFYLIHYIVISVLPTSSSIYFDFMCSFMITIIISLIWYLLFEKALYTSIKRKIIHPAV